ncbi:ferritin-like domain-containing protein [Shewanella sedimentimangrovi]|uniref:Iminophenyl-pyruvate dimer synthase domain-containing protein n=1 Tax=Shewanella sedimentimangrovi TaxID=2814293 RepID=A0ABX7R0D4_9GAMM|nr:ferritin-like domain-containing protein [Shewanella sedimentimangrovi]QSX36553.1 hypothetical protein JYB85_14880 [Shewanella sedimentimangrovi]
MKLTAQQQQAAEQSFQRLGYVQLSCDNPLKTELQQLRELLHNALVLEHATIPPYLTMLYSLDTTVDWRISEVVRSVVIEEMLHFVLAANVLNAINGQVKLTEPGFLPDYPSRLPYDIDGIKVRLFGFSREAVTQGMQIEHPKYIRPAVVASHECNDMTIGEFYAYIEARLRAAVERFGDTAIFCGDPARQVPAHVFYYDGGGAIVPVTNLDTAVDALKLITDQGEGANNGVWTGAESEAEGGFREVAHYFRFNELYEERLYREGDTVESGPSGAPLPVPWEQTVRIRPDLKLSDYPPGEAKNAIAAFNRKYCGLLAQLQQALSGSPLLLMPAVVAMCSLRDDFRAITANPLPGDDGFNCAPTFEYVAISTHCPKAHTPMTQSNRDTLDLLQQAYSQGNLPLALSCMTEDVIWDISGPASVPYLGVFYGHQGFSRFWTLLGDTVAIDSAGIEQMFFNDNQAMAYGGEQGKALATGAPYHYDWALKYEFDNNHKISLMRQYFNPSAIVAALAAEPYGNGPLSHKATERKQNHE